MLSSRNWLYVAVALAGGFAGALTATQFAPGEALAAHHHTLRILTAEEFELVDKSSQKRASLQITPPRGMANLMMFDGGGNEPR
jgi:hypothetical protein